MEKRNRTGVFLAGITVLVFLTFIVGVSSVLAGGEKIFKIGISQFVEHPALDAAREGFIDGLKEEGFVSGNNIEIKYENAQADFIVAQTIARKFSQEKVDLVLAIATPCAQAAAGVLKDIPLLITAVTDPVAAGLVESLKQPGGNVTGTTDMNPVNEQFALIKRFIPEVKSVGILYNAGEVNSVIQVELARKAAAEMGLELKEATVSSSNEVALAVSALADRVDAIYVPTDNIIVSAMPVVIRIAHQNKVPVFGSESGQVEQGAVATLGIDYYRLGQQTGRMAARVLQGVSPEELPVTGLKELKLIINQKSCKELDLEIPGELLEQADEVID